MKKILLLICFLISALTFAQKNNGINYQAVIYGISGESIPGINNSNSPLANKPICLQFSIIDENAQIEYQEKITVTTDDFGMVNLVIGSGIQTAGYSSSFNKVVWTNAQKNLKVSLDQFGSCYDFEDISNQELTYVPFALSANNATTVSGLVSIAHGGTNSTTVVGARTNLELQNVDNTSDLNKPLSTATQTALNSALDLKANLTSPYFSGIPSAPTANSGNISTQLATTAFVNTAVINALKDVADEFTATSAQTNFILTQTPSTTSKVKMFINGIRISNIAFSISGTTLNYVPTNNGGYTLTVNDRIQFDYFY
jgi:hypothetical protein